MRTLLCLLLLSGCADNLVEEERRIAELDASWSLKVRVMRNEVQKRGNTSFDPRIDALEKSATEGVVEMRAAVARGKRTAAQLTIQKTESRVNDVVTATERDFNEWKGQAQRARRVEIPPFLAQKGATERVEFPHGIMDADDLDDAMANVEAWVAFCKKTGGRLSLTAPVRNTLTVRTKRGEDADSKLRDAAERRIAFAGSDLERILASAGLTEQDFAEVRLQPKDGPYALVVEVVEACVVKTP
jgi:hypothetical protein